jgi:hypothetical protein
MLFWIVAIVVVAVGVVAALYYFWAEEDEPWVAFCAGLFFSGLAGFVGCFVMLFGSIGLSAPGHEPVGYNHGMNIRLVALSDGQGSMGGIFVTATTDEFRYLLQEEDGAFVLQSEDARVSKIYEYEGSPDEAYLVAKYPIYDGSWYSPWTETYESSKAHYEFHVPAGSVVQNYDVDVTD